MSDAFLELYTGLDREGPGESGDVTWAAGVAGVGADARICDAGCGTGGDIAALLAVAPEGTLTAVDREKLFIDEVLARHGLDPRVTAYAGDMGKLKGPYDFIWCAGAIYFLGIVKALRAWRPVLARGGAVAFSEPCFFTETPSAEARAFWGDYAPDGPEGIAQKVQDAGYATVAARPLSEQAWERYYGPLAARIDLLRPDAAPDLAAVLDAAATEIQTWRAVKDETGYLLSVVRPE